MSLRRAAVLCMLASAAGCRLSQAEFATLFRWMTCDECHAGERIAAAAIGPKAVPTLARWLANGPPADRQQLMRRKFASAFRFAGGVAASAAEAQHVANQMNGYVDQYYQRSALSLSDIANDDATDALDDAIANASSRGYRPHVLSTIQFARGRIGVVPFQGDVNPQSVAFGDSIRVSPQAALALSGAEAALLPEQPFSASDLVLRRTSSQLVIAAVGPPGQRWLQLRGFPGSPMTSSALISVSTLADISDRATRQCAAADFACLAARIPAIAVSAVPHVAFLSLSDSGRTIDTVDYFKIQPANDVSLKATLDWKDSSDLNLDWLSCTPPWMQLPPTDGATGQKPESTLIAINGGECRMLRVRMVTGSGQMPTFARLTIVLQ